MISGAGMDSKKPVSGSRSPQSGLGTPCLLPKLADPRIGGWAPGLVWEDGEWVVDRRVWRCCGGTGYREMVHQSTVSSCSLMARLKLVRAVQAQYQRIMGRAAPIEISGSCAGLRVFHARWGQIARGETHLGLSFGAQDLAPGSIWSLALGAAWRFGLRAVVAPLASSAAEDSIYQHREAGSPMVILVDGSVPMWDPLVIDRMERLIHFCHGGLVPLFILMGDQPQPSPPQAASVRKTTSTQFATRIAKAKARSLEEGLGIDARAKLREVTSPLRRPLPTRP